jgi:hypothetical protein
MDKQPLYIASYAPEKYISDSLVMCSYALLLTEILDVIAHNVPYSNTSILLPPPLYKSYTIPPLVFHNTTREKY